MATFYNQASLSYNGTVTNSNVTTGEILDAQSVTKFAITESYGTSDGIAYGISIINSGMSASDFTVTDTLGAFTLGTETVYPLEYVDGSVRLFIGGIEAAAPTVTQGPPLTFTGINIPAGSNAIVLYEARTNGFTPVAAGSSVTNTVTVGAVGAPITDSATVPVREEANLTITKSLSPVTVTGNGELTYTFVIQNTGNLAAGPEAGIAISDSFNPVLSNLAVTLDGAPFPATAYTYDEATGLFTTSAGEITVPAATYTTDPVSGAVTATPGTAVLTVSGSI